MVMGRKARGKRGRRKDPAAAGADTADAPPSPERAFAEAAGHYQQGRLAAAEKGLLAIQRRNPGVPDVLRLLALIALRDGRAKDAAGSLEKAVAAAPGSADLFNLLGGALGRCGRAADALTAYQRAVALAPGMADAHYNLANALKQDERLDEAIGHYGQAVELDPGFADAHFNLGGALRRAGRAAMAADAFAAAARANPGDAEALVSLGSVLAETGAGDEALAAYEQAIAIRPGLAEAHFNRGNLLALGGRGADAIASYRQALAIEPKMVEAMINLGEALLKEGEAAPAAEHFRAALEIQPGLATALGHLGNAELALGRIDDALASYRRALDIEPDDPKTLTGLGLALEETGALAEAVGCHRRAMEQDPDQVEVHHNLGLALLRGGQFGEGWREFEWRRRLTGWEPKRDFPQSPWSGEPVAGKTILVCAEQGVGDEVLYAGMVPDLIEAGAHVVLECERRLVPLFERSFPDVACVVKRDTPAPQTQVPDIDYHVAAGSLGRWLRPDLESFPGRASYLAADPARRDALRKKYTVGGGLVVGVAWISRNKRIGSQKSMTLGDLAPLAVPPGITLVDLQYGDTEAERRAFAERTGVTLVHDGGIDQMKDLDAFAAQVAAMDLVISVSNTTVHMAGALGVPVWVMLHMAPLNYWMVDRDDSPWYPSARLFRQSEPGRWADVIGRVEDALAKGQIPPWGKA